MTRNRFRWSWAFPTMLGGSVAWAQSQAETLPTISVEPALHADTRADRAAIAEPRKLPEIIVTAQKGEQLIEDVPISITAISGDVIRDSAAQELADLTPYMPNVRVVANDPGVPQLYIRGFGTNPFNPSFESSVGVVQDDVYFGRSGYFNESLFDVERVEVLRGSQGTLFGKNTVAGVFNLTSRAPAQEWSADARLSYGSHDTRRIEGGAGGMFADWGGVRVSGLYRDEDGELLNPFLRRDQDALRQRAGRIHFLFLPVEGVTSQLVAQTSSTQAAYWPFQLFKLDADTHSYLQSFDAQIEDDPRNFRASTNTPGFIDRGSDTVSLKTTWALDAVQGLRSLTPVLVLAGSKFHLAQLSDVDVSPADIARLDNSEDHRQFSAELRLAGVADSLFGAGGSVDFVAGGFHYDAHLDFLGHVRAGTDLGSYLLTPDLLQLASGNDRIGLPGVGIPAIPPFGDLGSLVIGDDYFEFDYVQDLASDALFGHLGWRLNDRWALTAGLRLNRERKRANSVGRAVCPGKQTGLMRPCVIETLLSAQDYERRDLRRKESDVLPKVALQYFFDRDLSAYAAYTRGFKSGGFNAISFTGEALEFEPEKARTLEFGLKGRALNGALRFSAALYRTEFDDLQVLAFNGVFLDVSNAASAESQGLEADVQWLTKWPWLRVFGSFGLLDARYKAYSGAPAPVSQGIGAQQDLSGERIAFAPRATASLTPTFDIPFEALALRLAVDVLYQGDQFTDTDLDPATRSPAHTQFGARASLSAPEDRWSLILGGTNLGDERVLNQVVDTAFFPGTFNAIQVDGRQIYMAISVRF